MTPRLGVVDRLRSARTRLLLRGATRVGLRPTLAGQPAIMNQGGVIEIGDDFFFSARPASSHLLAPEGGRIVIGNRVRIAYGAAISARAEVVIQDDVEVGPFSVIMDSDYHVVGDRSAIDEPLPVRIEAGAKLGARVTVLRGSVIGAGAVVLGGSVVSGKIPAGATVSGVPARVVVASGMEAEADAVDLSKLVMGVLGLSTPPADTDGPGQIREWDSLGALKIVLAVEEAYGVSLSEKELKAIVSLAELAQVIESARARLANTV
ncbi:MAG TPA: phosphopantetheine-binding protein [Polyangiaceae bacterium]|nr:phosphopantetheine-binding protein [Polyangiaceae bacterium]